MTECLHINIKIVTIEFVCKYSSCLYSELIDAYVQQSRASLVGDQFLYSCYLNL